jgi:hypothetical protein
MQRLAKVPTGAQTFGSEMARSSLEAVVSMMDRLGKSTSITATEWDRLGKLVTSVDVAAAFTSAPEAVGAMKFGELEHMIEEYTTMTNALVAIKTARAEAQKAATGGSSDKELMEIDQQINALRSKKAAQDAATQQFEGEKRAVDAVRPSIDDQVQATLSGVSAVTALASAWQSVASAAAMASQVVAATNRVGDTYASSGSLIRYFDRGGLASRGTDQIPAMLSSGEYVMSSSATQRWYSQLVAMNAGSAPSYRSEGGPVTNAGIVGDVTVNVHGGTKQTGRDVAAALNREIRRGSVRLKI